MRTRQWVRPPRITHLTESVFTPDCVSPLMSGMSLNRAMTMLNTVMKAIVNTRGCVRANRPPVAATTPASRLDLCWKGSVCIDLGSRCRTLGYPRARLM